MPDTADDLGDAIRFPIDPDASPLCAEVVALGFGAFDQLARHVAQLSYGRLADASDPLAVLRERRGTCSSKHQLLGAVALACGHHEVRLTVGIYLMSEENTPGVGAVLRAASLPAVPEAHAYLTRAARRLDFTGLPGAAVSPFTSLQVEHFVQPVDLPMHKPRLHRQFIAHWAAVAGLAPDAVWAVREACITALADRGVGARASQRA